MLLTPYDPWKGDSPYRQQGPIYLHVEPECQLVAVAAGAQVPEQQTRRLLSVRAYDREHMMTEFVTTEGKNLIEKAEELFGNQQAEYIHVYNAGPGCFAVRIDRGE
jgi:hypothetical protein